MTVDARAERDHWIRLFNRLEKATTDAIERNPDDDALEAAHRAVMRDAHKGWQPAEITTTEPF